MLTVVIPRTAEPTVVQLTHENLLRELASVHGSELLITDSWGEGIVKCRTEFICLVEPDCLVNSGYFSSMVSLFKKNPHYRQLGIMGSSVAINDWAKRFYGYHLGDNFKDGVIPNQDKESTSPYAIGIVYIPGSVIRMSMFTRVLKDMDFGSYIDNLVKFSTNLSLSFWDHDGRIAINPNSTYVTTEEYVGEQAHFDPKPTVKVLSMFAQERL